jgi:hypothetical protein
MPQGQLTETFNGRRYLSRPLPGPEIRFQIPPKRSNFPLSLQPLPSKARVSEHDHRCGASGVPCPAAPTARHPSRPRDPADCWSTTSPVISTTVLLWTARLVAALEFGIAGFFFALFAPLVVAGTVSFCAGIVMSMYQKDSGLEQDLEPEPHNLSQANDQTSCRPTTPTPKSGSTTKTQQANNSHPADRPPCAPLSRS